MRSCIYVHVLRKSCPTCIRILLLCQMGADGANAWLEADLALAVGRVRLHLHRLLLAVCLKWLLAGNDRL